MQYTQTQLDAQKALVERAKTETDAFGEIFDTYYAPMHSYCVYRCGNLSDADEVVSNIFYKVLGALPRYRWTGVPLDAWLYRIAANEVANYYRSHKYTVYIENDELWESELPASEDVSAYAIESERAKARMVQYRMVKNALGTLPPKYQEVIALRFNEDKKMVEIAEILGKPEGTVRSLLSRALTKLRKAMQQYAQDDVIFLEGSGQ
jgi:RNA polymerase sigma-70 factor (ECF subfamily)